MSLGVSDVANSDRSNYFNLRTSGIDIRGLLACALLAGSTCDTFVFRMAGLHVSTAVLAFEPLTRLG